MTTDSKAMTFVKAFAMFSLVLTNGAIAQSKPKTAYTVGEVIDVFNALNALDVRPSGTVDASGNPVMTPNNFKFGGSARMAIATNLSAAKAVLTNYQQAIADLRVQVAGPGKDVPKDKLDAFQKEAAKMLSTPSTAALVKIKEADLCLEVSTACKERNDIPVGVLSLMLPIIDR